MCVCVVCVCVNNEVSRQGQTEQHNYTQDSSLFQGKKELP